MGATQLQSNLSSGRRINLGSFYTPEKYVRLVGEWLKPLLGTSFRILDPSCGYGAFFALREIFPENRFIGNDIDPDAVKAASEHFPGVEFTCRNVFVDVCRKSFGLTDEDRLVIVGNPPYNDITSQIARTVKTASHTEMDSAVKSNDLGIASLKAYAALRADYVAVLHPLSFLVKRANFTRCGAFFSRYRLRNHIVFNSQEFAGTSRNSGFPVIVALYARVQSGVGLTYDEVCRMHWQTVEGASFSLAAMDFVTDVVEKYPSPHPPAETDGFYFYTLRDINALKRSRTFVEPGSPNAIRIPQEKFAYYCYIDCFKRYAEIPYYLGNLNIPYCKAEFPQIAEICRRLAIHNNRDYFGYDESVTSEEMAILQEYLRKALTGGKLCRNKEALHQCLLDNDD